MLNVICLVSVVLCVARTVHVFGLRLVVNEISVTYGEDDDAKV